MAIAGTRPMRGESYVASYEVYPRRPFKRNAGRGSVVEKNITMVLIKEFPQANRVHYTSNFCRSAYFDIKLGCVLYCRADWAIKPA